MARDTAPTDQTATTSSINGGATDTDDALNDSSAVDWKAFRIAVVLDLDVDVTTSVGDGSATATCYYSTNGGSLWTTLKEISVSVIGGGTDSDSFDGTLSTPMLSITTKTPAASDIRVRVKSASTLPGTGTSSATADLDAWVIKDRFGRAVVVF